MAQKFMTIITTMFLTLILATSCRKDSTFFGGFEDEQQPQAGIPVSYIPEDSANVTIEYSDGTFEPRVPHTWTLTAQDTIKTMGTEAFKATERLEKIAQNEMVFGYNYDKTNRLTVTGLAMSYKGKTIYPKDPSMMLVKGSREVAETAAKPFYELSATNYALVYGALVLASARQMFLVDEGYIPSFENNVMLDHRHNNVWAGQVKNNVLPIYCGNEQLLAQKWDDGSLRDSAWVAFECLNPFVLDLHEVKTDDFATMQKVYTLNANGETTINGVKQRVVREADASVVGSVEYNNVEYRDSVHKCYYDAKTITLVSTDSADITFVHREGLDKVTKRVGFKVTVVTLKEVLRRFWHTAFPKEASVSGKNITVFHKDKGEFQLLFSDNTKSKKDTIDYGVTHFYEYSLPTQVSRDLKGKTVSFSTNGNISTAEALVVTFKSRTVGDIIYNGDNYKNEAAKCDLSLKSAVFGETTVVITFVHDKETVTATVPVSYEAEPTLKEIVRSFVHGKFNTTGDVTGYNIKLTCSNPAHFYKLFTDGSKKEEKKFDFYEYNYFTYSMGEMPRGAKGNTYQFSGNTATVIGKNVTVTPASPQVVVGDIMYDGTNYKNDPKVPECKATVKSISFGETTATITFVHDSETITVTVPVTYEAEPYSPFEGTILCGSTTDHYADHVSSLTGTDDHVLTKVADGDYRHYWRPMGSKNWSSETLSSIGNLTGKNLAWWYETDKSTRHLGAVEAYEREGESNRWLLIYKDMNGSVQYHLGKAEETINAPFRYPVQRTLQKVVKGGKTLWTFDNVEFFASK